MIFYHNGMEEITFIHLDSASNHLLSPLNSAICCIIKILLLKDEEIYLI